MNVLYLSYDGMTDQLGQSQVIPYLAGLSESGYHITLISFEKSARYKQNHDLISKILKSKGIAWEPLSYTKWPPGLSTIWDVLKLRRKLKELLRQHQFQIVHCRSYITALAGLELKEKLGIRFVFDMRGFWADERVEGKLWSLKNPVYKRAFDFFKEKEKQFFIHADQVVSLTNNARQLIENWKLKGDAVVPIEVIPCCADLDHFNRVHVNEEQRKSWKNKLKISEDDFIMVYLGAIGTWYMLDEMLDFFKCLAERNEKARFLFITHEPENSIYELAKMKNISQEKILITASSRSELPALLSLTQLSIFFIRPSFSKRASSPTKQGEIMGMGIPIICNSGIGDTDRIIEESHAGIIIDNFSRQDYNNAIDKIDLLLTSDPAVIRAGAEKFYSLKAGVESYKRIYQKLER